MACDIIVGENEAKPIAVVRDRVEVERFGNQIATRLSQVYDFLSAAAVRQDGHNIVLYRELYFGPDTPIEVGVEVSTPFESAGSVRCSSTPAGRVVTTMHVGLYQLLKAAHHAVRDWCSQAGYSLAGPHWEVYGDWSDDPAHRRTEVVLREPAAPAGSSRRRWWRRCQPPEPRGRS